MFETTPRLTRRQAAILGAYTGIALGPLEDLKAYAREKLGADFYTHDMASERFWEALQDASRQDLLAITAEDDDE